MGLSVQSSSAPSPVIMKTATIILLAALVVLVQARRSKKYPAHSHNELQKEADNKIHHGPVYKKLLSDEEFAKKKARYYKKLRLGEKHREANTKHDQDNFALQHLQHLQDLQDLPRGNTDNMQKPTNFNKVMKLKSLKPKYKMEKYYKKMLAKEKMRMKKKKHSKKQQKHQIP